MPQGDVLDRLDETDTSSPEEVAHYVRKDKLTDAYVFGTPVLALCGKMFIPHRDPEKLPVCNECKDTYEGLPNG